VTLNSLTQLLSPAFREDLATIAMPELRERKTECQTIEEALSYLRRLVQGRHDIARAELDRRATGAPPRQLGELVDALPQILSNGIGSSVSSGRNVDIADAPDPSLLPAAKELYDELETTAGAERIRTLIDVDADVIRRMVEDLHDLEQVVSARRRALHRQLDAINDEIIRRYQTGEATVDALLS
jgi:hypothetical protein